MIGAALLALVLPALGACAADAEAESGAVVTAGPVAGTTAAAAPSRSTTGRAGSPGATGGGDPYWPADGNGGTDALHYDVRVAYDFATGVLRGTSAIRLRATQDLASFSLDLLLPVRSARVAGRAARVTRTSRHDVRIRPAQAIPRGTTFTVQVVYAGRPASYGYAGERNWLADAREVVTMNQPHMAPWWFPSNDHPGDKATFDIRVTVPRAKRVVSNGVRVSTRIAGSRQTTHWRMVQPMTTYLAFFAAGDFEVEAGRTPAGTPVVNAVSRRLSSGERTRAWRELRRTGQITDWLEARLGPYPFSSTGGVVTSLDVGFALENQSRPTYGSWIYRSIVVHELAHQWFGDSVAVERWRDIWLNEGFATYFEVLYDAHHGGPSVDSWLQGQYDSYCVTPGDDLWSVDLRDPGAAQIFDNAVYERGAMVLAALGNVITPAGLADLLRAWAAEHRRGNASVADFEAFAESETGKELTPFFDAWLGGGVPDGTAENGLAGEC
ncbi:M1 family metallopeptidase [Nocardioides caeni]|uniref:M1 family metallopeptidase n=1 Tax=Nocardioides caeni TaxID=574700 RepID=UPI001305352E|nr:M1 family metallopeptidase [Nocardioides caeni]